ncbi:hypothetical protein C8F04DRAFT_595941 [Mycena alexandri]|uniref:F-box domain-containing protein n=1 Tax=Mycena alexandri TaxID=1745969 RepID=A0AAD6TEL1_9AGAR|nr:hypothetical protein C8F04DRAFT_595941 [Mycena alexandri]
MSNAILRAQFDALTSSISQQKLLLDEMQTQLESLQAQLDSIVYPVLTLPPEIMTEIFLYCLPEQRKLDVVNTKEAPLLLTHVCGAWRHIACSTPRLWTAFYITEKDGYLDDLANIAETWFTRAGKCALSVKFHGSRTGETDFVSLLPGLRRHAREMRSLELHAGVGDFVMMPPLECVSLQKLSIRLLGYLPEHPPVEIFTNGVPLLREALMNAAPPSFLALPWQQLTKFTGELYTVRECMQALRAMPNLTECAFGAYDREDDHEVFSHPNIRHFTLFKCNYTHAASADALGVVTLPALQTLEIKGVDDFDPWALDSFLLRSAAPLRKLVIRPSVVGNEATEVILSNTFLTLRLTELEIWHPSKRFIRLFFDSFAQDANALPRLRSLSFRGCDFVNGGMTVGAVVDMAALPVTQRRNLAGCAQLQSFHVVSKPHRNAMSVYAEARLLPFKKLKESGMDIYIGTEEESVI